jgi:hypothetical protein
MSLLISETYANNEVPLWLDKELASDVVSTLSVNGAIQTIAPSGTLNLASVVFPTPVNYAKVKGWINIQNGAGANKLGLTGCSVYLTAGAETTTLTSRATALTGITIAYLGATLTDNFLLLDNLVYFNPVPFTTLNLYISSGLAVTTDLRCFNATGSNTYSSLPTFAGWTCNSGAGTITAVGGLI